MTPKQSVDKTIIAAVPLTTLALVQVVQFEQPAAQIVNVGTVRYLSPLMQYRPVKVLQVHIVLLKARLFNCSTRLHVCHKLQ